MDDFLVKNKDSGISVDLTVLFSLKDCNLTMDKITMPFRKNDVVIANKFISYATDREESLCLFEISRSFLDELFFSQTADCKIIYDLLNAEKGQKEYLFFSASREVSQCIEQITKEYSVSDLHTEKMLHLYLVELVTLLDRARQDHLIVNNSTMVSTNRFGKIMKYMGDHYADCSLQEIAKIFGYNPDYLSVRFQKITGMTFSQKLLQIRLERACSLLNAAPHMSIEEISEEIGFKEKSYFMRKFKEKYGMTPRQFRITHQ